MTKLEIKKLIESFNNAAFLKFELIRNEKNEVTNLEVFFTGTNFALQGIQREFGKLVHVGYDCYYMIFKYSEKTYK